MKEHVKINIHKLFNEIQSCFVKPEVNKSFWIIAALCVINIIISFYIISIILEILGLMVLCALALSREESYLKNSEAQWEILKEHGDTLEYDVELTEDEIKYTNSRNNITNITKYSEITHYKETKSYFVIFDKDWQYLTILRESELMDKLKKKINHAKKIRWILYW